ncbi:VCBS domain-containing protein [Psychromonas sp. Urea-02u-13]|uniref:VCBS domain-containing protein n=1 Tax=Psychromonas sp. Urea-02u-13 TaxID=2058326 RepID=UPI000C34C87C|nr:VCBS domain-containing protein [Psychromonas sp. Urea-02u-13]PKG39275.1 hypothetical protein CXF74_08915 [Psychromonas sp. Urea-02u-13]
MIDGVATDPVVVIANTNSATASDSNPIMTIEGKDVQFILVAKGGDTWNGFENIELGFNVDGKLTADGVVISSHVYYQDHTLNEGNEDYFDETDNGTGTSFTIGIEDTPSGDDDYNDLVITINQTSKYVTNEDTAITIDALNNDSDPDGDLLTITHIQGQSVTNGSVVSVSDSGGVLLGNAKLVDGKILFTPVDSLQSLNVGQNQEVSFQYTVNDRIDGTGESDTAMVDLIVSGLNDPSIIEGDDNGSVTENVQIEIVNGTYVLSDNGKLTVSDINNNDSPIFTTNVTFNNNLSDNNSALGQLVISSDGTWNYQVDNIEVQYLDKHETVTEVYTVRSEDGSAHDITIVINGAAASDGVDTLPILNGGTLNDTYRVLFGEYWSANQNNLQVDIGGNQTISFTKPDGTFVSDFKTGSIEFTNSAQIISSGSGNDHVETGAGNDIIYAGETGSSGYESDDDLENSVETLKATSTMSSDLDTIVTPY